MSDAVDAMEATDGDPQVPEAIFRCRVNDRHIVDGPPGKQVTAKVLNLTKHGVSQRWKD